jgi:hypothetical protein
MVVQCRDQTIRRDLVAQTCRRAQTPVFPATGRLCPVLLALFGVVVGALAIIQKLDSDQIGDIVRYELPLSRMVAQFDVDTDRYELNILRALRLNPPSSEQLEAAGSVGESVPGFLPSKAGSFSPMLATRSKCSAKNSNRLGKSSGRSTSTSSPIGRKNPRARSFVASSFRSSADACLTQVSKACAKVVPSSASTPNRSSSFGTAVRDTYTSILVTATAASSGPQPSAKADVPKILMKREKGLTLSTYGYRASRPLR